MPTVVVGGVGEKPQTNGQQSGTHISMATSSSASEIGNQNTSKSTTTQYTKQPKSHKNLFATPATPQQQQQQQQQQKQQNDDLFQMIERVQSRRFDEQRAVVKSSSLFRFGRRK